MQNFIFKSVGTCNS